MFIFIELYLNKRFSTRAHINNIVESRLFEPHRITFNLQSNTTAVGRVFLKARAKLLGQLQKNQLAKSSIRNKRKRFLFFILTGHCEWAWFSALFEYQKPALLPMNKNEYSRAVTAKVGIFQLNIIVKMINKYTTDLLLICFPQIYIKEKILRLFFYLFE
ncbi:hypothetical protein BY458DRAFT_486468 [Sporodiniella umbellata]|nr:hypothetical protein BY458DRAFT_486468 [Sporodiniella umbellata]